MSPARPGLSREFIAGHKRRRMMDAIADLSAEQGYAATKIADVVRRAGVARKTLYDNFDGKEELFLAALDSSLEELRDAVLAACERHPGSLDERLVAGLEAILVFVAEKPAAGRMCLLDAISATLASKQRYDAAVEEFVGILTRAAPGDPKRPPPLEDLLVGGVAWILQRQLRSQPREDPRELLSDLAKFVLSPYHGVRNLDDGGRRK